MANVSSNKIVIFDADDTLWHNENIFENVHAKYRALLVRYHDAATVERTLFETEMRNLDLYGYGVKAFTLSAIETAIELTRGELKADEVKHLLELGREMLAHPVSLLEDVGTVLTTLGQRYTLAVITKGDLRDQERKIAKSGLRDHFAWFEVVSEKDPESYARVFAQHNLSPASVMMVGNSLKSDIQPVLELGGAAAYVPYPLTWAHEHLAKLPEAPGRFWKLEHLRELPATVALWAGR